MTTWPVHRVVAPGAPVVWETGAARAAAEGSTAVCHSPRGYGVTEGACRLPQRVWKPQCWGRLIGPALWSVISLPQPAVLDSPSRRIIRFQKFLDQPEPWCSSTVSRKDSGNYRFLNKSNDPPFRFVVISVRGNVKQIGWLCLQTSVHRRPLNPSRSLWREGDGGDWPKSFFHLGANDNQLRNCLGAQWRKTWLRWL